MYYLISHVVFQSGVPIYGPIHVLESFLKKNKKSVQTVFLPLGLKGSYIVRNGKESTETTPSYSRFLFKYIYDVFFVFKFILNSKPSSKDTIIAVDPLNCFPAVLLKNFFNYKLIYYTADYSDKRFPQFLLNIIYLILDKVCLESCEQNWCVSQRIVQLRKEQGYSKKAKFLPNTPILPNSPKLQKDSNKYKLIYVGRMDENMNLLTLLKATKNLHKTQPKVELKLIGGGKSEKKILKYISDNKMNSYVSYLGPQPNLKVISAIKTSGVGLALYSGGNEWNRYGDSMKIREYQYFGLPVVTTTIPSNSNEVKKYEAGHVLGETKIDDKELVKAVKEIQRRYKFYSKNTYQLANDRLKEVVLKKLLKNY